MLCYCSVKQAKTKILRRLVTLGIIQTYLSLFRAKVEVTVKNIYTSACVQSLEYL